jgi:hypothetical protein
MPYVERASQEKAASHQEEYRIQVSEIGSVVERMRLEASSWHPFVLVCLPAAVGLSVSGRDSTPDSTALEGSESVSRLVLVKTAVDDSNSSLSSTPCFSSWRTSGKTQGSLRVHNCHLVESDVVSGQRVSVYPFADSFPVHHSSIRPLDQANDVRPLEEPV